MIKTETEKIKIEFDDTTIEVPRGWEQISLSDYEKIYLLKPESQLEYIQYVADVCKIDAKVLLDAPVDLFNDIVNLIEFIFKPDFTPGNKVVIDEKEYVISFSDKLTLGEWVDFESVIESESKNKLSEILAIVCRPKGEKYSPDLLDERIELFKSLSCEKVLPLVSFFLLKKRKSDEIFHHYSTTIAQAERFLKDIKTLPKNGAGIKPFPTWRMIKYYFLTRSLKKQLSKYLDSCYTSQTKPKQRRNNTNLKNK